MYSTISDLVQSIRSFDPGYQQIIKIFTPLTLIVGQNGSGKTTIIECLRYATTGELPPNSATGGAWIHDPKLNGESETKAMVKLSFIPPSGQYMVSTRRLLLTVKKTMRSQKTMEGEMIVKRLNGENVGISTRVAELDTLIPHYLGVSKAILDSVIFCHQDDSLWPMSTPALLKKKFDEIFEAHKYTKAIENIKVIRKKQMEELSKFKIIEAHAKDDKEKGARTEKRSQELFDQIELLKKQHEELEGKIKDAVERSEVAYGLAAKFEKLVSELEGKQLQERTLEKSIKSISMNMREMKDSDQELRDMQDQYEEHMSRIAKQKDELANEWNRLNAEVTENRQTLGKKQTEVGRLENDMQRYERQLESRKGLIKESARRHKIWDMEPDITEAVVKQFTEDLARSAREQQSAWNKIRQETQDQASEIQKMLDSLNERRSGLRRDKETSTKKIEFNDSRIADIQIQLSKIDVDEGSKAVLATHVQELEDQLKSKKEGFQTAEWNAQLDTVEGQLAALSDKKERLVSEQAESARQATDLGQLEYLAKELKDRQTWMETNSESYDSEFKKTFGVNWSPSTLDQQYKSALAEKMESFRNAEIHQDRLQRDHEHYQYQIKEAMNGLASKRQQLSERSQKIRDVIDDDPENFPDALEQVEANCEVRVLDKASFGSRKDYYKQCSDFADSRNMCRLCERLFKGPEKSKFMERMKQMLDDQEAKRIEEELKYLETELANHRSVRTSYESWIQLGKEIPLEEKAIADIEAQRDELVQKLEAAQEVVKQRASQKSEVEVLAKPVQSIVKCQVDISNYKSQISELETKQTAMGSTRAPTQIQEDMKQVNVEIKKLTSQKEQLRNNKERMQNQIGSLEIKSRDERAKLTTATRDLKDKSSLESQIVEYKSDNEQQRISTKQVEDETQLLLPQISQTQEKMNDVMQRGASREQDLQVELSRTKDTINQLELASKDINEFIAKDGPRALARSTHEMESIEKEIERLEGELKEVGRSVNKANEELRNHDDTKRAIADNLTFREHQKELIVLKEEIADLEESNSLADKLRYEMEGEKWQLKRNQLSADQASIMGTLKSKDDQLQGLLAEWELDYKDAAFKFKEANIKVEVTQGAIEDLACYAGALDKAIMKYHGLKMEEINRIIADLWRRTYKGSDVDTIMIRSEHENTKGNKSYNYRVVMVKQNAEMDMRGRCSAGQKVLASLIIRLALAECFSVNCGIIALDEPTTNLDRDNIISLARSLHDLIKIRRKQRNFQLIVITHDEEFLQHMNCAELTDDYFRVSRDERQKSQIRVQKISQIYQ
jgi:DNA repair protein RAD50